MYELAREQQQDQSVKVPEPVARPVLIESIELLSYEPTDVLLNQPDETVNTPGMVDATPKSVVNETDVDATPKSDELVVNEADVDVCDTKENQPATGMAGSLVGASASLIQSGTGYRFRIRVTCGGGTYIRSIVHDIGEHFKVHAYMTALERTQQGPFFHDASASEDNDLLRIPVLELGSVEDRDKVREYLYNSPWIKPLDEYLAKSMALLQQQSHQDSDKSAKKRSLPENVSTSPKRVAVEE
jgi:tRNA U55 pseudouridine synthase TruB